MIPKLDPELLLLIAQHVQRPVQYSIEFPTSVDRAIRADRSTLVNLIRTSKSMYNLAAPVLYRDIITDDFPSYARGLRTNENIDHTVRLHINHQRHWYEEDYQDILTSDDFNWIRVGLRSHPHDTPPTFDCWSVIRELNLLVKEGTRIRQFITEGLTILPRLQTVSMGGFCGNVFNDLRAPELERVLHEDFESLNKTLPHALLDLPTVKHFCQAVAYGPLSLPNKIIKPDSAIVSYTVHQRGTPMFCSCNNCNEKHSPPIVLGAKNRYYCGGAHLIPSAVDPNHYPIILDYLRPILSMFTRPAITIADPDTGTPIPLQGRISTKLYKGTTVEIYNYIRILDIGLHTLFESYKARGQHLKTYDSMPPESLAVFQENLDRALPEVWKGKVKLMDREEAPPCLACGFNPQDGCIRADVSKPKIATGHCPCGL